MTNPGAEVSATREGRGGAWFDDGTIVFAPDTYSGLMRVSATGGEPVLLAALDKSRGESSLRFPTAVGRRRVLYLAQHDDDTKSELRLLNLDTPAVSTSLVRSSKQGVYANGRIFYDRQGIVVAQTLDEDSGAMIAEPVSVTDDVVQGSTGQMLFTAAAGAIAWWKSRPGLSQLEWLDCAGRNLGSLGEPEPVLNLDLSPDDRFAAVVKTVPGTRQDIWILDTTSNSSEPLIEHSAFDAFPVWSPDGSRLAFQSSRGAAGNINLYVVAIANRSPIPIVEAPHYLQPAGWTPDGQTLAWIQERPVGTQRSQSVTTSSRRGAGIVRADTGQASSPCGIGFAGRHDGGVLLERSGTGQPVHRSFPCPRVATPRGSSSRANCEVARRQSRTVLHGG